MLTAALLVLLPALALLQYQWVGQLSEAERERMQRNLRHAASQFRESFDGELARAFISLQADSAVVRDEAWDRYAERYAAWAGTTASPGLVANVFLVDAQGSAMRIRRWNGQQRRFEHTTWDGPLAASRKFFESELAAFGLKGQPRRRERPPFRDDESLLVAPLMNVQLSQGRQEVRGPIVTMFGFTVLQLNMPLIREQLVPALAQRHFTDTDGAAYRVAVVDAEDRRKVIFRSSPDASTDPARADVAEPLFGPHGDGLMLFTHGPSREQGRETRNLVVSVIRERRDDTVRTRILERPIGRWRLLVQHERGSLEAAVASVRQRNLLISFGILLLMGVAVGLLMLSSRRAQRLAKQQMEFVAGVSHELRTPVAVIRSAAENLSHGVVGDPDHVRRYGDAIQVEARRLGEMVERVLHFAGIESGRAVRSPIAVEPLIQEAIAAALPQDGETMTIERHIAAELPPVVGDTAALRSAIQNLVVNAVKYGGRDRWILIRAEAVRAGRTAHEVRITVEDHGKGIATADLPYIFDPFYRGADAMTRPIQGSGLGLALVRRIAQAHGGRVTVVTREGAGSAFTLHLPAAASTPESVPFHSPNEAASR